MASLSRRPVVSNFGKSLLSEVVVDLTTRSCNIPSASKICSRVLIVGQTTDLTVGTDTADAHTATTWSDCLLNNTTLVGVPEGLDTVGNAEVAYVTAAFEGSSIDSWVNQYM